MFNFLVSQGKNLKMQTQVDDLRREMAMLRSQVKAAQETMEATIADRDRWIAAKSDVDAQLAAKRAEVEELLSSIVEFHDAARARIVAEFDKRQAELKGLESDLVGQLDELASRRERKALLLERLEAERAAFDAARKEHADELERRREAVKTDELRWMSKAVGTRQVGKDARKTVADQIEAKFETMRKEHSHMLDVIHTQNHKIQHLLSDTAHHAARQVKARLDLRALLDMNRRSQKKLAHLSSACCDDLASFESTATPPVRRPPPDRRRSTTGAKPASPHKHRRTLVEKTSMRPVSPVVPPEEIPDMRDLERALATHLDVQSRNQRLVATLLATPPPNQRHGNNDESSSSSQ